MIGEFNIETLTIEQYLMLTQGNQAPGMVKPKFGMKEKDIEDMTIAEYMEYEAAMKRQSWRNVRPYFPTNQEDTDISSFHHNKRKVLDYPHHSYDSKTNVYYDLPSLLPCFKPVQLPTICRHELLEDDIDYVSKDESEMDKELSSDDDLDDWLKTKMERRMCGHDKEGEEDALIVILKSLGVSFVEEGDIQNEEGVMSGALPCQLPPKELNPRSFTLPCTIGSVNLYVMADLGASVNIMPRLIYEHLRLANLKETDMLVVRANMTEKTPLGIVENILVKINKFLFPSDFMIMDTLGEPNEIMILGRPFLEIVHAQIDVFKREISLGFGEDRLLFDMDGNVCHSNILVEKVYMKNSIQNEEPFNPLEIGEDLFSYESPSCLQFEQRIRFCNDESIDTVDSSNDMQDHEVEHKEVENLENITSRWHVGKPVRVFYDNECGKDCGMWPTLLNEWVLNSFDVKADYGKMRDDPRSRRFDEYRKVFDNEIKQLANEYDLRIGKKRYSFMGGRSFICITKQLDDALPLGRVNGSRFIGMIRKEMDKEGGTIRKMFSQKETKFEVTLTRIQVGNWDRKVDLTKEFLSSRFSMKDIGEVDVILGIKIKHESNGIAISHSHYIDKVLKKFNYLDCTPVSTPMITSEKRMPNNGQVVSQLEYSMVIGCLMYSLTCTWPYIAFVVGKLSRYTSNPGTQHCWINNTEDNLSTSGWVFLLGRGALSWASKKQTCITGSIIESKFMALAAAGKEAEWLRNMLLKIPLWSKPIAPISILLILLLTLALEFVRSQLNLAGHLTKGLARDLVLKSAD
ncbi:zinc finger, CCHC-type containing protein [Tanacetum coccineum]